MYLRDTTTGLLTAVYPATVASANVYGLATSPDSGFAYTLNYTANTISQYSINPASVYGRYDAKNYMYFNGEHLITDFDTANLFSLDSATYKDGYRQ